MEPTPSDVRRFADFCRQAFNARIVRKKDSLLFQAIALVSGVVLSESRENILHMYAQTFGTNIGFPVELGDDTDPMWGLWTQMDVLAHECVHVEQYKKMGLSQTTYLWAYKRAELEGEAFIANYEMAFWRYGATDSLARWADSLAAYRVSHTDIEVTRAILITAQNTIKRGGYITAVGKVLIPWLDRNLPHLKEYRLP